MACGILVAVDVTFAGVCGSGEIADMSRQKGCAGSVGGLNSVTVESLTHRYGLQNSNLGMIKDIVMR